MQKLFEFIEHIGKYRVLVQTRDINNRAITEEKMADDSVSTRTMQDGSVTEEKIAGGSVTPEKLSERVLPEVVSPAVRIASEDMREWITGQMAVFLQKIEKVLGDMQDQIDGFDEGGVAVSNEFGSNPHISISQQTLTQAVNKLWQKLEDMTGEALQGIRMAVTPDFFISEDACQVHIMAHTVETNGIFEHIAFYSNGALIAEADGVEVFEYDAEIEETTVIKCVAKIMGVEYTREQVVTHYHSFWLGAAGLPAEEPAGTVAGTAGTVAGTAGTVAEYVDVMNEEHVIPITNGMRGAYNVSCRQGDHIVIVVGESLRAGFIRADMNSVEIPFTESTVEIKGKRYVVFTSVNAYGAGEYNIDING